MVKTTNFMEQEITKLEQRLVQTLTDFVEQQTIFTKQNCNALIQVAKRLKEPNPNPYSAAINCTIANIIGDLNAHKVSASETTKIIHSIEHLLKITPSSEYQSVLNQLEKTLILIEKDTKLYQVLNTLLELTTLEYDIEYEATTYHDFVECIFYAMEHHRESKDYISAIMVEVKQYLSKLSSEQLGDLIVEHFTIDYDRNSMLYLRGFSSTSNVKLNSMQSLAFVKVLETLEEEFLTKKPEEKVEALSRIYQTDFYQENHFSSQKNKKKSEDMKDA